MKVSAIVPTLGRSPLLAECLAALRREGREAGLDLEILVVDQRRGDPDALPALPLDLADRVLRPGRNLGFAGGTNRGIAASSGDLVAMVNDDAVVEPGWLAALSAALRPGIAAAQGVNLEHDRPGIADGCGMGWGHGRGRTWQTVQVGTGRPAPSADAPPHEIFGASATAALFRRADLERVALPGGQVLDERLGSYYEDVDLACRLRAAGAAAVLVPAARCRHAGSTTGRALGWRRWAALYGNRHLILARLLGRGYWPRFPLLVARDGADLLRALGTARGSLGLGILAGWGRAVRNLPAYLRWGRPAVAASDLVRFREGRGSDNL